MHWIRFHLSGLGCNQEGRDFKGISELSFKLLIVLGKTSCILGSLEIPILSLQEGVQSYEPQPVIFSDNSHNNDAVMPV